MIEMIIAMTIFVGMVLAFGFVGLHLILLAAKRLQNMKTYLNRSSLFRFFAMGWEFIVIGILLISGLFAMVLSVICFCYTPGVMAAIGCSVILLSSSFYIFFRNRKNIHRIFIYGLPSVICIVGLAMIMVPMYLDVIST